MQPQDVAQLLDQVFAAGSADAVRSAVSDFLTQASETSDRVRAGTLMSMFSAWLLPEVTYLPSVLNLTNLMRRVMPCTMIGYDALPMTEQIGRAHV